MAAQKIMVGVWLDDGEVAMLDGQVASHNRMLEQDAAMLGREFNPDDYITRETLLAVRAVEAVRRERDERRRAWRNRQRFLELLARRHGFKLSKDLPVV